MRLTVIGCGTAVPDAERVASGYLVETAQACVLLDCGPGVLAISGSVPVSTRTAKAASASPTYLVIASLSRASSRSRSATRRLASSMSRMGCTSSSSTSIPLVSSTRNWALPEMMASGLFTSWKIDDRAARISRSMVIGSFCPAGTSGPVCSRGIKQARFRWRKAAVTEEYAKAAD